MMRAPERLAVLLSTGFGIGYSPLIPGTLGCLLGLMNHLQQLSAERAGRQPPPPLQLDCRSCTICKFGQEETSR